jgi:hypothetical protein
MTVYKSNNSTSGFAAIEGAHHSRSLARATSALGHKRTFRHVSVRGAGWAVFAPKARQHDTGRFFVFRIGIARLSPDLTDFVRGRDSL